MGKLIKAGRVAGKGNGDGYVKGDGYVYGKGNGNGYGYGNGDGDGYGYGNGKGYGDGNGYGDGDGYGYGYGNGYGYGKGDGKGYGDGTGNGYGNGDGYGYGGGGDGYGGDGRYGQVFVDPSRPIIAYHYVPEDRKIRYAHGGSRPEIEVGLVLEWAGEVETCKYGLHASLTPEEAETYCTGVLTKVACSGQVKFAEDKFVCSRREIIEIIE